MLTFDEFYEQTKQAESEGRIQYSKPIDDFDLLLMYTIGVFGNDKGYPCDISVEELILASRVIGLTSERAHSILLEAGMDS